MKKNVSFARIYLTEQDAAMDRIIGVLQDQMHIAGVTVFRGIAGYGDSGRMHHAGLLDMSLDLPLVIEFYDSPEQVERAVSVVRDKAKVRHVVTWAAQLEEY